MLLKARAAVLADAADIAAIYNQGIEDRVGTFETAPREAVQITAWFGSGMPVVVVVDDAGAVVAYAAAFAYSDRCVYGGIAEFSVYVGREARGRGAGTLVMAALLEHAESAGYWKLVSRVFPENMASRALLRKLGFREVGIYEKHARLDGAWRDVVIVERLLPGNLT